MFSLGNSQQIRVFQQAAPSSPPSDWIASWRQELHPPGKICQFSGKLLPYCMHRALTVPVEAYVR
jgi:hypothetical protein